MVLRWLDLGLLLGAVTLGAAVNIARCWHEPT